AAAGEASSGQARQVGSTTVSAKRANTPSRDGPCEWLSLAGGAGTSVEYPMTRARRALLVAFASGLLAAGATGADELQLSSPAFAHGRPIPRKYTCDGADLSPPLRWSGAD